MIEPDQIAAYLLTQKGLNGSRSKLEETLGDGGKSEMAAYLAIIGACKDLIYGTSRDLPYAVGVTSADLAMQSINSRFAMIDIQIADVRRRSVNPNLGDSGRGLLQAKLTDLLAEKERINMQMLSGKSHESCSVMPERALPGDELPPSSDFGIAPTTDNSSSMLPY